MTDPEPSDRPLVTFALFAYNQEQYVREAIEGAFAQTYEPLEIILSDDCSTDRTFEIMREMAAAYEGPHTVIARRNPMNYGTAQHVQAIADGMTGALMVVAAGDDVSLLHRVARIVDAWEKDGYRAPVLHSQALQTVEGRQARPELIMPRSLPDETVDLAWFVHRFRSPILPPTAAYARQLFEDFPPLLGGSIIEDGPLIVRGLLCGRFLAVEEPLVHQRRLKASSGGGHGIEDAPRWNRLVRSKMVSHFNHLQDLSYKPIPETEKTRLERWIRRELRGLSRCSFVVATPISLGARVRAALIVSLHYPTSIKFIKRLYSALNFSGIVRRNRISDISAFRRIRSILGRIKTVGRRARILFDVAVHIDAESAEDKAVLRRVFRRAPSFLFRDLACWRDPTAPADCRVGVRGIGSFRIRADSDDLYHLLPTRESAVIAAIRQRLKPGDTFVDAGANIGIYSVLASRLVGPRGKVIAIEMMPDTASILQTHLAENGCDNVTVVQAALSDRAGRKIAAHVPEGKFGQASIVLDRGERTVAVETATLAEVLVDSGGIALIKMDLEGAEPDALRGAEPVLDRVEAILFEDWGSADATVYLAERGFSVTHLDGRNSLAVRR